MSTTRVAQNNIFWNDSVTPLAGAASFTGVTRDTGCDAGIKQLSFSAFNVQAFADQAGTLRIDCSNDGTTWRRCAADQALTANSAVILSVPTTTRYYRAVFTNGATLQTAFMLNTSFTHT